MWYDKLRTLSEEVNVMLSQHLFDVHTHTQFYAFKDETDAVIQRALDGGIWMVNVGTQRDTSAKAVEIAQRYREGVYATVGLHPIHTEKSHHDSQELGDSGKARGFTSRGEEFEYELYKALAQDPKVVAIGECGLDYYRLGEETKEKQKATFLKQIELAHEVKKPLMIHCRNAFRDLIDVLVKYKMSDVKCPGIVHFFTGTKEDAKKFLEIGFLFSFGGVITFARDYDDAIKYIPLDRIVLETDAPYVTPVPYRGRRNEPMYVVEVAKKLAELKNVSVDEVSKITTQNAFTAFSIGNGG